MKPNPTPILNANGFSVKNCELIYAPKGQAGEYSKLATNPYRGCGHKCLYCYVPGVLHMTREEFDAGAIPRENWIPRLTREAQKYEALGIREQVMLSFTTDPYHPTDNSLTRQTLQVLQAHGLGVCTLTKGGHRALRDIDLFRPDRDAFASTLTSLDPAVSEKWERGATLPDERIDTLKQFHDRGLYTWVSLEPVFDTEATLAIIERCHSFVSLFKLGRINYSGLTKKIDWHQFTDRAIALFAELGAEHYIKEDLQKYLPAGYQNNKYRNQTARPVRAELPVISN